MSVATSVEIVPTGAALGAEVRGVDLSEDQPGDVVFQILQAFAEHQALLFRDQTLTNERQLEASEWFGPRYVPTSDIPVLGDENQSPVVAVSNVADGGVLGDQELQAHSDFQFMPVPLLGAMLYAVEVPAEGGRTSWSNLYQAYDELDEETKTLIAGEKVWALNPYAGKFGKLLNVGGANQKTTDEEVPRFYHPVVRTHPVTGRKSLFISTISLGLDGYDDDDPEGRALMRKLRYHIDQDHLYWTHRWRPGDVVVWDNRCTNHKRESFDPKSRRVMYRVQIAGSRPF